MATKDYSPLKSLGQVQLMVALWIPVAWLLTFGCPLVAAPPAIAGVEANGIPGALREAASGG